MAQFTLNEVQLDVPDTFLTPKIRRKMKNGMYEAQEARGVLLSVDYGDRVLELGAGVGYIGALAGMIAGPENVLSVEANPALISVTRANFDRNECTAIELRHGAVVDNTFDGNTVQLSQTNAFWASHIGTDGDENTVAVPALRFSDLVKEHRPDVVIMDIEGAEEKLFEHPWPEHIRVVLLEIHPRRYSDVIVKKIFECLLWADLIYNADLSKGKTLGFLKLGHEV